MHLLFLFFHERFWKSVLSVHTGSPSHTIAIYNFTLLLQIFNVVGALVAPKHVQKLNQSGDSEWMIHTSEACQVVMHPSPPSVVVFGNVQQITEAQQYLAQVHQFYCPRYLYHSLLFLPLWNPNEEPLQASGNIVFSIGH